MRYVDRRICRESVEKISGEKQLFDRRAARREGSVGGDGQLVDGAVKVNYPAVLAQEGDIFATLDDSAARCDDDPTSLTNLARSLSFDISESVFT